MKKPVKQTAVPLAIVLPAGQATLVEWTEAPWHTTYQRGDEVIVVDTRIPQVLLDLGWFWFGSSLTWQPDGPGTCYISVWPGTFPPPTCYEVAWQIAQEQAKQPPRQLMLFDFTT